MPRPFLVLIAFILVGIAVLGSLFMWTGPMDHQARSPHEIGRQENGLTR